MTSALVTPAADQYCLCCGRPMRRPRPTAPSVAIDTRALSDADVYRHFHRTAPVEDLRFFLRHPGLSPLLRAEGEALLALGCRDTGGTLTRPEWYRRLTALQDRWRRQSVPWYREVADVSAQNGLAMAEAV